MADLVSEIAITMWDEDFWGFRDDGQIEDLSNPLSVVMLVIAFRTEVEMNGIVDFLGNSTGIYAVETVGALRKIACHEEADCLEAIIRIAAESGMSHEEIQNDLEEVPEYTVTSFRELHGEKWDGVCDAIRGVEKRMDLDCLDPALEAFAAKHADHLREYVR